MLTCRCPSRSNTISETSTPTKSGAAATKTELEEKKIRDSLPVTDYSVLESSILQETLGLQGHRHSHLIGYTSEYETTLVDLCPFDDKNEYALAGAGAGSFRRISPSTTFVLHADAPTMKHGEMYHDLDMIERIVAPHGEKLIDLYFRIVHPSFPILHRKAFMEKYARTHREFSPPLLAAVYILALHWWNHDKDLSQMKRPDVTILEQLARKTLADVMHRPKLSAVQAGLLLLQRTNDEETKGSNWILTSQLVAVGQELGLHLDCSDWRIPKWEKGLRKRLAWALFMQDKWSALTHGRPSHISKSNWAVRPVIAEDFPEAPGECDEEADGQDIEKGRSLFEQMIALTSIMSDVLDTFFSVEVQMSTTVTTQKVLEKAKPIQIRLKEWFIKLPECLRMEVNPDKPRRLSSTGYLHLAYFATEITLHRQILRTLSSKNSSVDPYLLHICRSAAKTRLISAMDFVNRLKPEHLQSFWYFASKVNFSLIATFGSLLWATSPTVQEAEFYKARLSEYRWTLRVSSRGAEFMEFAVRVLDTAIGEWQQDEAKRRGLWASSSSSSSSVFSTYTDDPRFGLGMGVGLSRIPRGGAGGGLGGLGVVGVRPPPPPQTFAQFQQQQQQQQAQLASSSQPRYHNFPPHPIPTTSSGAQHQHQLRPLQHAFQHSSHLQQTEGSHHPPSPMSVEEYDDDMDEELDDEIVGAPGRPRWRASRSGSIDSEEGSEEVGEGERRFRDRFAKMAAAGGGAGYMDEGSEQGRKGGRGGGAGGGDGREDASDGDSEGEGDGHHHHHLLLHHGKDDGEMDFLMMPQGVVSD